MKVKGATTQFVINYLAKRIVHDRNACHDEEALKIAIEVRCPKLVCGTVTMMRISCRCGKRFLIWSSLDTSLWMKEIRSQRCSLLELIANLPNIQQVLITGDQQQLPPYTRALTDKAMSR